MLIFPLQDDLRDVSRLEEHIEESEVVLIVVTDKYLSSYNCRRELAAAMKYQRLGKPLILLLESDEAKGATTVTKLRAELEALKLGGKFSSNDSLSSQEAHEQLSAAERFISLIETQPSGITVLQYHRERHLKLTVFKVIASVVHAENAVQQGQGRKGRGRKVPHGTGRVVANEHAPTLQPIVALRELRLGAEKDPPSLPRGAVVFVHPSYRSMRRHGSANKSYFEEITAAFVLYNICVVDEPVDGAPSVLLLCPGVFDDVKILWMIQHSLANYNVNGRMSSRKTASRFSTSSSASPLLMLFCTSVPFSIYMDACPHDVKEAGIFRSLFQKWPGSEVLQAATAQLLASDAAQHFAKHGLPVDGSIHCSSRSTEMPPTHLFGALEANAHYGQGATCEAPPSVPGRYECRMTGRDALSAAGMPAPVHFPPPECVEPLSDALKSVCDTTEPSSDQAGPFDLQPAGVEAEVQPAVDLCDVAPQLAAPLASALERDSVIVALVGHTMGPAEPPMMESSCGTVVLPEDQVSQLELTRGIDGVHVTRDANAAYLAACETQGPPGLVLDGSALRRTSQRCSSAAPSRRASITEVFATDSNRTEAQSAVTSAHLGSRAGTEQTQDARFGASVNEQGARPAVVPPLSMPKVSMEQHTGANTASCPSTLPHAAASMLKTRQAVESFRSLQGSALNSSGHISRRQALKHRLELHNQRVVKGSVSSRPHARPESGAVEFTSEPGQMPDIEVAEAKQHQLAA